MLIYLYGGDSYRRNKKLKELLEAYTKKYGIGDVLSADLEENPDDWKEIKKFLTQTSLFVPSKLAIVKNSGAVEDKEWIKLLKSHLDTKDTFIIISDDKAPKKALSFLLSDAVKQHDCPIPVSAKLDDFLKRELNERNLILHPNAYRYFLDYLNSSVEPSWVAVNELDKLKHAKFPAPISLENIRKVIDWRGKRDVRDMAKFIASVRDWRKTLPVLEPLFLQKDSPAFLFNTLPYLVFGRDLERLADYDFSIKTGGLDYEEALLDFVISRQ